MPVSGKSPVIPSTRYRDATAALDWLCRVLGFSRHLVVPGEAGTITHAQLALADGMIMLGSERDDAHGQLMAVPGPQGTNTQSVYLVVDNPRPFTTASLQRAPMSSHPFTIRNTGAPSSPAATPKATSGTSVPTILGRRRHSDRAIDHVRI